MAEEEFNRLAFLKGLAKKYNLCLDKVFETLLDAETSMKELVKTIGVSGRDYNIKKTGGGPITTKRGKFYQMTFKVDDQWSNYLVIIKAELDKNSMLPRFKSDRDIFLRIDSGCISGQIFCDLTCECREQLDCAMETLNKKEQGIIIHILSQDGRGKGTEFKLATLYLQETLGLDTAESFTLLEKSNSHTSLDSRSYEGAIGILKFLGATKNIVLATNNPKKLEALRAEGIEIKSEPIVIQPTEHTYHHLKAKKSILGHKMPKLI